LQQQTCARCDYPTRTWFGSLFADQFAGFSIEYIFKKQPDGILHIRRAIDWGRPFQDLEMLLVRGALYVMRHVERYGPELCAEAIEHINEQLSKKQAERKAWEEACAKQQAEEEAQLNAAREARASGGEARQ
jgi:hypothetical protein